MKKSAIYVLESVQRKEILADPAHNYATKTLLPPQVVPSKARILLKLQKCRESMKKDKEQVKQISESFGGTTEVMNGTCEITARV